jgi:hypothetical protein
MTTTDDQTRTRQGMRQTHGRVTAETHMPKLKFPFLVTGGTRAVAAMRRYRCPQSGAKV